MKALEKLQHAIAVHQQGHLDIAEKFYRDILKKQPSNPDALHFFGVLLHQRGQSDKAIDCIRRCLTLVPTYLDAKINLGNIYQESGDFEKAAEVFQNIIKNSPQQAMALNNLGVTLRKLNRTEEAVSYLLKAVELSPKNADFLNNLAEAYQDLDNYDAAYQAYRQAIEINPLHNDSYYRLWRMSRKQGHQQIADQVLVDWLDVDPNNPIAKHHFSACLGVNVPDRASDAYVKQTFDKFAASFDEVLKSLDYLAPQCVAKAVGEHFPLAEATLKILDAGCGTGLCGPFLKPYAQQLLGVDLSGGMLNKAQGRGVYDELIESDLVAYLVGHTDVFNMVVSADTLCYFGCLQAFCEATYRALVNEGVLIFTVEHCQDTTVDQFKLNYHGRYSHRSDYITAVLKQNGFDLLVMDTTVLRKEAGKPVEGLLVTAIARKF